MKRALLSCLAVAGALVAGQARGQGAPPPGGGGSGAGTPAADATSCMRAFEAGQEQQQRGELLAARATFRDCSASACPEVVRDQCVLQIEELTAQQPTVVLAARDTAGRDTTEVAVLLDGQRIADRLGGLALPLDPGRHLLRFELGTEAREVTVVVSIGEKNRKVLADFYVPPAVLAPSPPPPEAPPSSGPPAASWVLGGVGVVGLGSFVVWGLVGRGQEDRLDACRTTQSCGEGKVDAMYRSYTVADISLGVGVLALGAAALTWALAPTPRAAGTRVAPLQVGAGPGDIGASLRGSL